MAKQQSDSTPNAGKEAPTHPGFTTTSIEYAHDVYLDSANDSEIEEYLNSTDSFDPETKQWLFSAGSVAKEALVKSVHNIVSSIVSRFVKPSKPGVERRAVNVHGIRGNNVRDEEGSSPYSDIVLRASGPSFEDPVPAQDSGSTTGSRMISFSNISSCIAVKLDSAVGTAKSNVKEMEGCARRIFASQPNRLYVRCMVVTEKHVRMVHFDRAGAQTTPLIDIHQHPATFVRLVAGLASADERLLGLDNSVQWTIVDGRKAQGTVTTRAPDGTVRVYPIVDQIPIARETYLGRGTACWRVRDPETSEELVIKDSWRPDDRPSEHEFLKLFDDIPGVVQMVSYETGRGETKDYRCASTHGQYPNRASMRLVMKSYGKSVEFFTSALQLLCAIRDAIAGHQRLLGGDLKILHRDVSHNNILIGRDGAKEGHRGTLIDFDMAFRATDEQPEIVVDYNVGTRIFQSLCVLGSFAPQYKIPAHDYLDDLESFFFVIIYIFLIHRPDGSRVSSKEEGPAIVAKWDDVDPSVSHWHKRGIFGASRDGMIALEVVEKTWGPICTSFYKKFRYWMSDVRDDKLDLVTGSRSSDEDEDDDDDDDGAKKAETLECFLSRRDEHYSQVLSIFDEAIEALQGSPASDIVHEIPALIDQDLDTSKCSASDVVSAGTPSANVTPLSNAESSEPSPSTSPLDVPPSDIAPAAETTTSTPSSSLEPPAPSTPPPTFPSAFAVYSNPSSPRLKRRSEDAVHPDSPPSKGRRISDGLLGANRSP